MGYDILQRVRRVIVTGFLLICGLGHGAAAQTNGDALKAMEAMRFSLKAGDEGEIAAKMTSKGLPASAFSMVVSYSVMKVERPTDAGERTGYRLAVRVKSVGMEGMKSPRGFDELMQAMFPPIELRTNDKLEGVEIVNWEQVEQQRKAAQEKLTAENPRAALALLMMTTMFVQKDQLLSMFEPVGEMQQREWRARDGGFDLAVTRRQGMPLMGAGPSEQTVITGQRRLIPVEVSDGRVRLTAQTAYDAQAFVAQFQKSPMGKLLGPEGTWDMKMSSTGDAEYDRETGWITRLTETLRVELRHPKSKIPPREEIVEYEHTRTRGN